MTGLPEPDQRKAVPGGRAEGWRRRRRVLTRLVCVWLLLSLAVLLAARTLPAFRLESWTAALLVGAGLGLLNAAVWPLLVRLVLGFTVLTLGFGAFALYAVLLLLVLHRIPGVQIVDDVTTVLVAVVLAALTATVTGFLDMDDDEFFRRRVARGARRRSGSSSDVPGVVFVQIDGLGHDVLRRALRDGNAPTLAGWLAGGTHRLTSWETDWSSQTGASQCALLHGSNEDVPAFRWYEKDTERLMVCNHRADAAEIERRHSDGNGLLASDGASRGNLFTGDAAVAMMTMSVAGRRRGRIGAGYYGYMANPANASRTFFATVVEVLREWFAAAAQRQRRVRPRVPRGGVYPFLRAFTTIVARDVIVSAVLEDLAAGRSVVYATFVGYDEVAHHSGVERYDALAVLRGIDREIGRLQRAARLAPRPYRFVVLSDHGQSQGLTFSDAHGTSLEDMVRTACGLPPCGPEGSDSGWPAAESWQLGAGLLDAASGGRSLGRALGRAACHHDDSAAPDALHQDAARAARERDAAAQGLLVLASGSLGMVYLTGRADRFTREEIDTVHPGLVTTLREHPGIGFVLVRSAADGPVVLGRRGSRHLLTGRVTGVDPLAAYGPLAADRVLRTDGFAHTADIVLNAAYNMETDEVSAFENLVGSHGGMGGAQTRPFLLYPAGLPVPPTELVGAEAVHLVLRGWLAHLGHPAFSTPPKAPAVGDRAQPPAERPGEPSRAAQHRDVTVTVTPSARSV